MEQTLYRKYRPQTFSDLASQEHVKQTLQNQLKNGRVAHAYLFTGPRGVGKTTTARLIAKAVNCEKPKGKVEPCNTCAACQEITAGASLDVYEIDAASNTGVDNVRENIIEGVRFAPNKLKYKVYIIDEVHMLSTSAFNALLKTLEEPPAHALFILATTEIHKVPATIVSRCQRFDFKRIPAKETVVRLKEICKEEGVSVAEEVLFEIARHSEGCERDAESLLGQLLALGEKKIGVEEASLVMPATHTVAVIDFLRLLANRDAAGAIRFLNEQAEQGVEMGAFLDGCVLVLRTVLFAKLGGLDAFKDEYDADTQKRIASLATAWTSAELTNAIELFLDAKRNAKSDAIPQLAGELVVVKLTAGRHPEPKPHEASTFPNQEVDLGRAGNESPTPPTPPSGMGGNAPTVLGDVPLLSLDEVQAKWPAVFEKIQACNASLPLIMQAGELGSVDGGVVELRFEYSLHAETINRAKNKQLVEGILGEVLGKNVRVNAVHAPNSGGVPQDEAVSSLLQEFGGQAV
jgi:DNA polymerase-3 subunit gamma/tau